MKVAIQGQRGSFHSIAAKKMIDEELSLVYCTTFREVFESLDSGKVDRAVVAVENSLYGSINQVYQLFDEYAWIVEAEHYLRIEHCLIGMKKVPLSEIVEVRSQAVALAQCEDFLNKELWRAQRVEFYDTAGAVESIMEQEYSGLAAIASDEAAKASGAVVLKRGVETNNQNYTRFFLLRKGPAFDSHNLQSDGVVKASFVVRTDHSKGSLAKALGQFAEHDANLTRIESRPVIGQPNKYRFYIDAQIDSAAVSSLVKALAARGCEVVLKGVYQEGVLDE